MKSTRAAPTTSRGAKAPTPTLQASTSTKTSATKTSARAPQAFTLIELLVVTFVLALVAAMATVRWSGVHADAAHEGAIARWASVDRHLRGLAATSRRERTLELDDDGRGRFRQALALAADGSEAHEGAWETLPGVRLNDATAIGANARSSPLRIVFGADGQSPTYGFRLAGPAQRETWILVAGVSGELVRMETEGAFLDAVNILAGR